MLSTPSCKGVDKAFMDKAKKSTRERILGAMAKGVRGLVLRLGSHTLYTTVSRNIPGVKLSSSAPDQNVT